MASPDTQRYMQRIRACLQQTPIDTVFYDKSSESVRACKITALDAENALSIAYTDNRGAQRTEQLAYVGAEWYAYPGYHVCGGDVLDAVAAATGTPRTPRRGPSERRERNELDSCEHQWGPDTAVANRVARECAKCHVCILK